MPPTQKKTPEAVAFGERVRDQRLARGWTQEVLAEKAELHVVQLSHIERGANEPKLTTILRIARALRVSFCKLLPEWRAELRGHLDRTRILQLAPTRKLRQADE